MDNFGNKGRPRRREGIDLTNRPDDGGPPEAGAPQPIFLLPGVVTAIAGLMVAVHLAAVSGFNQSALESFTVWFGFIPFRAIAPDAIPGGWLPLTWTLVTHAFLHAGWEHLVMNTVWLAVFATPVARRYGSGATVAVFLVSAAAGALAFAATTLPDLQLLIGASGGVAGLTGAATRFIFQPVAAIRDPATGEVRLAGRRTAPLRHLFSEPRTRYFVIIWVALNAAVPLFPLLTGTDMAIAWQAHLGGFIAGLLLVSLLERRYPP